MINKDIEWKMCKWIWNKSVQSLSFIISFPPSYNKPADSLCLILCCLIKYFIFKLSLQVPRYLYFLLHCIWRYQWTIFSCENIKWDLLTQDTFYYIFKLSLDVKFSKSVLSVEESDYHQGKTFFPRVISSYYLIKIFQIKRIVFTKKLWTLI